MAAKVTEAAGQTAPAALGVAGIFLLAREKRDRTD